MRGGLNETQGTGEIKKEPLLTRSISHSLQCYIYLISLLLTLSFLAFTTQDLGIVPDVLCLLPLAEVSITFVITLT